MVDNKRSLLKYIVFSVCTLGIYSLYFIYKLVEDVNVICRGDGEETPGLMSLILFSICTLGIYSFVWYYRLGNRIQRAGRRYDLGLEGGGTLLMWQIFGSLLFGLGPLISTYILIQNMNCLATGYLKYGHEGINPSVESGSLLGIQGTNESFQQPAAQYQQPMLSSETVFCKYCGTQNNATSQFCKSCGKEIRTLPMQASSQGVADESKKYKELFDQGVLTEDEFVAKKEQLLKLM
jgi:hypothetical protein